MSPKYRIKEVYYKNGDVYYFPQKKSFLFWHRIEESSDLHLSSSLYFDGYTSVREEAERVIELEKRREESDKVIKTSYTYYDESDD